MPCLTCPPSGWCIHTCRSPAARRSSRPVQSRHPAPLLRDVRRLSFDLTGLPPSQEALDAFLASKSPKALEEAVDALLESKHYGERMALHWLDLVRYADTGGYHSDNHRDIALYRDWVIKAFNTN